MDDSLVPSLLVVAGLCALWVFVAWFQERERRKELSHRVDSAVWAAALREQRAALPSLRRHR